MHISNYLSLVSSMDLFVMVPIHKPVDVISDQGYLIKVFILFMLIIKNKSILCIFFHYFIML